MLGQGFVASENYGIIYLRGDVFALGDMMIDAPNGAQVPLRDVAEIAIQPAPNEIRREGASPGEIAAMGSTPIIQAAVPLNFIKGKRGVHVIETTPC